MTHVLVKTPSGVVQKVSEEGAERLLKFGYTKVEQIKKTRRTKTKTSEEE